MLKKQLEEREKQLAAEQEDAAAARNRQRELTKVCHPSVVKKAGVKIAAAAVEEKRRSHVVT